MRFIYLYLLAQSGCLTEMCTQRKPEELRRRSWKRSAGLIWLFILVAFQNVSGQIPDELRTQHFHAAHGLTSFQINEIKQDRNSFLWVATGNGLHRFDGKNSQLFRKDYNDSNSLLDNLIVKLAVDKQNRIWIGYGSDGISCYDQVTRKFRHFMPDSTKDVSFPLGATNVMFIDSKNILWFAAGKNGLYRFDINQEKLERIGDLPFLDKTRPERWQKHFNLISEIHEGNGDTLWMACGDGFYSFHRKNRTFEVYRFDGPGIDYEKWKPDVFHTMTQMSPNDFYLGGWGTGLNHYDKVNHKWTNYLIRPDQAESGTSNIISTIERKSDDELWVSSLDTNLSVFNIREKKFYHIRGEQINATNLTGEGGILYTDQSGDLWFAQSNGLHLIKQGKQDFIFKPVPVTRSDNNMNYQVMSVLHDTTSKSYLINTYFADGLNVVDYAGNRINIPYDGPVGTPDQFGYDLFQDSRNEIWVVSTDYVQLYDRKHKRLIRIPQPVPDTSCKGTPYFVKAKEDRAGRMWFATLRHGIYMYDTKTTLWKQWFHVKDKQNTLQSNYVNDIEIDNDNNIWILYDRYGVSKLNPETGEILHLRAERGNMNRIIDDRTICAALDPNGKIWVGSFAGLTVIDPSVTPPLVNNFVHEQEFLGIVVYDILFDNKGVAWIGSSTGLTSFDPATNLHRSFEYNNDLSGFSDNYCLYNGVNDEMFVGAQAGYFTFSNKLATARIKPADVIITSLHAGDRTLLFEEELKKYGRITLEPHEDLFTAEFVSIYFRNPTAVSYRYRLAGIDKNWRTTGIRGFASYNNLPGGEYTLELQASLGGEWSNITTLPIFIKTPFYKTVWFNLLMVVSFAGMIFGLYRYRVNTIEKTETLKTQLNKQIAETEMKALRAQMNPHFIFNCLNSINRYIIKNDHKTASLYLTKFAKLIRLILDNSEHQEVELSQDLEALKLYIDIEALRFDHKFSYEIEVDDKIDQDSVKIPAMLIQPFVENAIWHGLLHKDTHGKMMIRVKLEGEVLVCEVEDDGVGREKAMELKSKTATTRKSLGLKITSDRLAAMESRYGVPGSVSFIDLKDENGMASGTKVVIKIPVEL